MSDDHEQNDQQDAAVPAVDENINELNESDIKMLREAEERGRERMSLEKAADNLKPILEDIARRVGGKHPPKDIFRCAGGCDVEVARRGAYCTPCAEVDRRQQREVWLAKAYASVSRAGSTSHRVDSLDWCRIGRPEYLVATQRARAGAQHLTNAEAAARIIDGGMWNRGVGNLVILGPKRIGKSKAAIAIGHRILDAARDGRLDKDGFRFACGLRFVSGLKLGRARKETKLGETSELERLACRATLLILDEVGYEDDREVFRDVVYDRCEDRGRPTIVTSGRTRGELAELYGPPTIDRLTERGVLIDLHAAAAAMKAA